MGWYEDHIFPTLLDAATKPLNRDRKALIEKASGCILELGIGTGANLPFYTGAATQVHGIEPATALLEIAKQQTAQCQNPERFQLCAASAEALPYEDNTFDCIIACLVFCTIPDPVKAATETLRVLKPGGKLLTLEHVQHQQKGWARLQNTIQPIWKPLACGCHLNRNTASIFQQAGFEVSHLSHEQHPKLPRFAGFMLRGYANKPA